jgi:hypothetical protein
VGAHEALELRDHLRVAAEGEIRVGALLECHEPQLLEPRDLFLRPRT